MTQTGLTPGGAPRRNVEIKARLTQPSQVAERASALATRAAEHLQQRDVFFHANRGRLKLRHLAPDHAELIYYERPDAELPTESRYIIASTSQPTALEAALSNALGVRGEVRKSRVVQHIERTRVHLDRVEGLGSFLELEVVLADSETVEQGEAIAHRLLEQLGVPRDDLIAHAYIDLLEAPTPSRRGSAGTSRDLPR